MTWKTTPIGTVIRTSQYGLSLLADPAGGIPIVGMKDIQDGRVRIDPEVRVTLTDEDAEPYLLKDGDILLNRTNSPDLVGKAGIYRGDGKAVFASYLVRLELDQTQVDPDFIIQILASEGGQRRIRQLATRAVSQANLNPTTFKNHFLIPIPALKEQVGIRDVLMAWDTAIETTERLIAAKERRHRALLVLLLGKRLWSESSHERADSLFNSISERNRPDLPVLAVTQDQGVVPRATLDRRITMELSDPATFKVVRRDDFVISLRSFQGGLEHSAYDGLVSPAYTVLRCGPALLPRFYRHYLKSPDFLKRLSVAVVGIRDGKQINFADFASLKLPLPNFERQQAIAAVLDESEKEIDLLGKSLDALKRQKRGLMQKLLTGEWRVPLPDTESTVKEAAPC